MTAHSLPVSDLTDDDPYVGGLREVSEEVATLGRSWRRKRSGSMANSCQGVASFGSCGGETPWLLAYQSKGMRPGEWLGPDLGDVFAAASAAGFDGVVVCPVGFATDHMETLYDLDIVAKRDATAAGLRFVRADVPNASPELIEGFARLVRPML